MATKSSLLLGWIALICLISGPSALAKEKDKPPSDAELAAISARGKLLAEYDQIAWHATDAVQALHPAEGEVRGYVVKFSGNDWACVFGHLSDDRTSLVLSYQVTSDSKLSTIARPVGKPDTGELFHEFLAMDTARAAMPNVDRPYNDAVLPADNGNYYVYFYPAQTDNSSIPMGGDWRFKVSSDGTTILEKRALHASVREDSTAPAKEGATTVGHFHTHVLSDVPEDTDVMYVLMRRPPVPEYVASSKFFYLIDADGTIHYVGETDKVVKK